MDQSVSYPKYVNPMIDAKALFGAEKYNNLLDIARKNAINQVRAKGLDGDYAEGFIEGYVEGYLEGYVEGYVERCVEYLDMAKAMLADGIAPEKIAKYTQITIETVLATMYLHRG